MNTPAEHVHSLTPPCSPAPSSPPPSLRSNIKLPIPSKCYACNINVSLFSQNHLLGAKLDSMSTVSLIPQFTSGNNISILWHLWTLSLSRSLSTYQSVLAYPCYELRVVVNLAKPMFHPFLKEMCFFYSSIVQKKVSLISQKNIITTQWGQFPYRAPYSLLISHENERCSINVSPIPQSQLLALELDLSA